MASGLDKFVDFAEEKVEAAKQRILEKHKNSEEGSLNKEDMSILEKLIIKCGPSSSVPIVTAIDMAGAGIDTTGNTISFLLYSLATNQEVQEKLRAEIQQYPAEATEKTLNQMKYMKAVIKESARKYPLTMGGVRVVPEPIEIKGYSMPANVLYMWCHEHMNYDERYHSHRNSH